MQPVPASYRRRLGFFWNLQIVMRPHGRAHAHLACEHRHRAGQQPDQGAGSLIDGLTDLAVTYGYRRISIGARNYQNVVFCALLDLISVRFIRLSYVFLRTKPDQKLTSHFLNTDLHALVR